MDKDRNESIACTIDNCQYHAHNSDYCTLNKIKVGSNEENPKEKESTDCDSFEYRAH